MEVILLELVFGGKVMDLGLKDKITLFAAVEALICRGVD